MRKLLEVTLSEVITFLWKDFNISDLKAKIERLPSPGTRVPIDFVGKQKILISVGLTIKDAKDIEKSVKEYIASQGYTFVSFVNMPQEEEGNTVFRCQVESLEPKLQAETVKVKSSKPVGPDLNQSILDFFNEIEETPVYKARVKTLLTDKEMFEKKLSDLLKLQGLFKVKNFGKKSGEFLFSELRKKGIKVEKYPLWKEKNRKQIA